MATGLADDFDDSDDEIEAPVSITKKNAKDLADSLDVDDMEANLFSSFKRKASNKPNRSITANVPSLDAMSLLNEDNSGAQSTSRKNNADFNTKGPNNQPGKADNGEDDLDDLLDLLSTEDDNKSKDSRTKKTKIKFGSHSREPENAPQEGKLITSKTRDGLDEKQDHQPVKEKELHKMEEAPRSRRGSGVTPQSVAKKNKSSGFQVNFDDDDDNDILSGLGFDDKEKTSSAIPPRSSSLAPSSLFSNIQKGKKKESVSIAAQEPVDEDESGNEDFQFGGYSPSISDPSPRPRSRSNIRHRSKTESLVPSEQKKSVRFSDKLEESDRPPFSSSATEEEVTKPSSKETRQENTRASKKPEPAAASIEEISHQEISPVGRKNRLSPSYQEDTATEALASEESGKDSPPALLPGKGGKDEEENEDLGLELPVFPWQKSLKNSQSKKSSSSHTSQNSSTSPPLPVTPAPLPSRDVGESYEGVREQHYQSSSREKLKPEMLDNTELKAALQRESELIASLEREKREHILCKNTLFETEKQVRDHSKKQETLEKEIQQLKDKVFELEANQHTAKSVLSAELEESKISLLRVELEKKHAHELLEASKLRHKEEIDSVQKSYDLRITSMEESLSRREARWRDELEAEVMRSQEKIQLLESEKTDSVLSLRRKLDSLEVTKTNEISRLKELQRLSIEDMKREHETERQHLIRMHNEEMESFRAAHSHTRMLSELNSKVTASTKEVSQLQAKLEGAHTILMEEKAQRYRAQESNLKALEEQLVNKQGENETERGRLQSLIVKLEAHISQQNRTMEQERWQLQQDTARLKAQQTAFRGERTATISKLEEDRDQLQSSKEKFLADQQEILARCYEDQRVVNSERAELAVLKQRAEEREAREKQREMKVETERKTSLTHLNKESERLSTEQLEGRKLQEELRMERKSIDADRERLEAFAEEIQKRSQEVDELCKSSLEIQERGRDELQEAQKLKGDMSNQSKYLELQLMGLREKEQQMSSEQLLLAEQRRVIQDEALELGVTGVNEMYLHQSMAASERHHHHHPHHLHHDDMLGSSSSLSLTTTTPAVTNQARTLKLLHQQRDSPVFLSSTTTSSNNIPLKKDRTYSPKTSPARNLGPGLGLGLQYESMDTYLAQLEQSINLRHIAAEAERDYEELKKEREFLSSLEEREKVF